VTEVLKSWLARATDHRATSEHGHIADAIIATIPIGYITLARDAASVHAADPPNTASESRGGQVGWVSSRVVR
jgi:hypothetical protein